MCFVLEELSPVFMPRTHGEIQSPVIESTLAVALKGLCFMEVGPCHCELD